MGRSKKANQAIAMLRMEFHPDLSFEVKTSYDWYEDKADGLGDDFLTEVELGLQAIIEYPDTWPVFAKGVTVYPLKVPILYSLSY